MNFFTDVNTEFNCNLALSHGILKTAITNYRIYGNSTSSLYADTHSLSLINRYKDAISHYTLLLNKASIVRQTPINMKYSDKQYSFHYNLPFD